ncbi:bifunctional glutamate N-acetyltransferase/amino-acid acetyltransferase ArgJ [Marinithermus hydrothermalis]|uniref:Arginine biosynthesis bifunctional protein ArgJ n=1 Tax=Marinithermus hydrothermalis (strain DSM 14884 / JCM 11576 / T1) TaxID=869210 RepID=F2NPI9_MARHT|nr:bifunctional glutamate N-acetyltransferase/amino-acid acetyltransferase ArgJ [Marinithermus hydrothermalis]AEB12490.1 Arginine biosynthesis bifunctional protein ArgJ [Marinithermus hydrothermalis DSM 14884]
MRLPIGFRVGAIKAGIKPSGRLDLGLILSGRPAAWAFVATTSRAAAPSVRRGRELYAAETPLQAVVVNAGNANCATGPRGQEDDRRMARAVAARYGLPEHAVLTASTGVIGVRLPVERIEQAVPTLQPGFDLLPFAEAILTTDTRTKTAEATLPGGARVVGVAKGSGMIHPNMATMLAYLLTDAELPQEELRQTWPSVVDRTFNQISVDGDTSTNDMAVLLANGGAGPVDPEEFWPAVERVARDLARQIARDGEGATRLITVRVQGAATPQEARNAARAVASSALWKAAVYGNDPNWGRVLGALGYSGATFDPLRVRITLQGVPLYDGEPLPFDSRMTSQAMRREEVVVEVDLREGPAEAEAWGCDLTEGYVRINAEYTT